MRIQDWKLKRNNDILAQVLLFVPGIEQSKVVQKTLSGAVYVQTIGVGTQYATIEILVTREELRLVNSAEADGALVSVEYRGVKYLGVIEAAPEWAAMMPGEWYTTTIKLLIEAVVNP